MSALLEGITKPVPTSKYWYPGMLTLDQGNVGACVGYTGANWMQNSPTRTTVDNLTGLRLYHECKKIDGIPTVEGTYARALLSVLKDQGRVKRYLWAQQPGDLKSWILSVGPVLVGTTWRQGMFNPDANGFVRPTGSVVGGHEYLVRGYSNPRDAYRCRNSWGRGWGIGGGNQWAGNGGEFWIKRDDLELLIWGGGENWGDAIGIEEYL